MSAESGKSGAWVHHSPEHGLPDEVAKSEVQVKKAVGALAARFAGA